MTLKDIVKDYVGKGYDVNFEIKDNKLFSASKNISFIPEQVFVVAQQHVKKDVENKNAVLYCIEAIGGYKGMIVDYNTSEDLMVSQFIRRIPKDNFKYSA